MEGATSVVVVNNNDGEADQHEEDDDKVLDLPPGFRFHPTDEEIITYYLSRKMFNANFAAIAIGEVDLNKCEPWDLPKKAKMGEKEWFFFCQKDRKYPTGMRTNRATESGYWKATGKDKEIYSKGRDRTTSTQQQLIGMRKTLVFYKGRAPKGEKLNWIMHEFRLEDKFSYYNFHKSSKDEWVVCRVVHKNGAGTIKTNQTSTTSDLTSINSFVEGVLDSPNSLLPPLMDSPNNNNYNPNQRPSDSNYVKTSGTNLIPEDFKVTMLAHPSMTNQHQHQHQMQPQNYTFNPMTYYQTAHDFNTNIYQVPDSILYQNAIRYHATTGSSTLTYPPQQMIINSIPNILGSTNSMQLLANQGLKVEQFSSNQSIVSRSQDTGLSTDNITAEISSKQQLNEGNRSYEDLDSFWSDE